MLKRILLITLLLCPTLLHAAIPAAARAAAQAAGPETLGRAQAAVVRTNVQGSTPDTATAPSPSVPAGKTQPASSEQFLAAPYVGITFGTRLNNNSSASLYKSISFALSAGVSSMFTQKFYLAGEIFLDDSGGLKTYINPNNMRSTWSFGFDAIPGYTFGSKVLTYLRIGAVSTYFPSPTSRGTGFRLGLGVETNLCDRWDTRMEYISTRYRGIGTIGGPQTDQMNIGLVYKFT